MSLLKWFLAHFEEPVVHFVEKELHMAVPQNILDVLARIKAALANHSDQSAADAATIANLQGQVASLTSAGQAKDQQIAALQQQVADAQQQINDIEAAVLAADPQVGG